jgi:capsular exopolysaccharide synthesis family protein
MSNIYEALQRAELERNAATASIDNRVAEPAVVQVAEAPVEPKASTHVTIEGIHQKSWKPIYSGFPTLDDRGPELEQFRGLRTQIIQARTEAPMKTVLISSGMPSEGKSFITANLAVALTRGSTSNVLLIDGDLRRPNQHVLFGTPNEAGLSEYFAGTANANDILQRCSSGKPGQARRKFDLPNLTLITAGKCGSSSSELVNTSRMEQLIAEVSPVFDWILIDSPPCLTVTDAVDLATSADAVLLVVRGEKTTYNVAQRAQAAFVSSRILGVVLNDLKDAPDPASYSYYYGSEAVGEHGKKRGK